MRLTSSTRRQSSRSSSGVSCGARGGIPALLIIRCRPRRACTPWTTPRTASASVTSSRTPSASGSSAAAAWAPSGSRSATTTNQPSAASWRASSLPIPEAPPVTIAVPMPLIAAPPARSGADAGVREEELGEPLRVLALGDVTGGRVDADRGRGEGAAGAASGVMADELVPAAVEHQHGGLDVAPERPDPVVLEELGAGDAPQAGRGRGAGGGQAARPPPPLGARPGPRGGDPGGAP